MCVCVCVGGGVGGWKDAYVKKRDQIINVGMIRHGSCEDRVSILRIN